MNCNDYTPPPYNHMLPGLEYQNKGSLSLVNNNSNEDEEGSKSSSPHLIWT